MLALLWPIKLIKWGQATWVIVYLSMGYALPFRKKQNNQFIFHVSEETLKELYLSLKNL
jgi:hypothetical protein